MAANTSFGPSESAGGQGKQSPAGTALNDQTAADMIRQKLDKIYGEEPDAGQELAEAETVSHRSKHQEFMYRLGTSGKDLATIQTEWHNYYQALPAKEKHQVWQEFYASQSAITGQPDLAAHKHEAAGSARKGRQPAAKAKKVRDARSAGEIQAAVRHKVTAGGKLKAKHHFQSLLFGLSMGLIAVLVFLFGFFNEVMIAPFIQPSRASASTPLIVSSDSAPPSTTPEIIIPKINVQIPVDYSQTTIEEGAIESALDNGIVHYPTTSRPGQTGNAAFFGHSSNNIFNKGKYKFAFVLLHSLVEGDTFYITYGGKVYVYKVISKQVVDPSNVGVLNPVPGQTATATLITCDPPGTSLRRLVVLGQQISPDPSGNTESTTSPVAARTTPPENLPGNGPTLWGRFISTAAGKAIVAAVLVAAFMLTVRWVNAPSRSAAGRSR